MDSESIDIFEILVKSDVPIDSGYVSNALLRLQLFPNVKDIFEELPPIFATESFTDSLAEELANLEVKATSWVQFRSRRFDGLVRQMGLPHPVTYSRLVLQIRDHWKDIAKLLVSEHSQIKPRSHADGRLIHMDYENSDSTLALDTRQAQGKRYVVEADVSSCFPSLYSHAIDWALRGKSVAKKERRPERSWQAKLDKLVRDVHDQETAGVMIGPAVSNLLSELVLQRVDQHLVDTGYNFIRYVDDFIAYTDTRDHAEQFIVELDHALTKYRLRLNTKKTQISSARGGRRDLWMNEIRAYLPSNLDALSIGRFFRHCEALASKYPDSSVLKFAVKSLMSVRDSASQDSGNPASEADEIALANELVRMSTFHPHLICFAVNQLSRVVDLLNDRERSRLAHVLTDFLSHACRRRETDVALWLTYGILQVLDQPIPDEHLDDVTGTEDDLVLLTLIACSTDSNISTKIVNRVLDFEYDCEQDRQAHWLIRYELFRVGLLDDKNLSGCEASWFHIAKQHGAEFSTLKMPSEKYADFPGEIPD